MPTLWCPTSMRSFRMSRIVGFTSLCAIVGKGKAAVASSKSRRVGRIGLASVAVPWPSSIATASVPPQCRQPVDLAPEAGDGLVDDLLHRLQLVDQPGALAGRARGVLDVAVNVEHIDQAAAR